MYNTQVIEQLHQRLLSLPFPAFTSESGNPFAIEDALPLKFTDVSEYISAFVPFILEEMRVSIGQGLNTLETTDFSEFKISHQSSYSSNGLLSVSFSADEADAFEIGEVVLLCGGGFQGHNIYDYTSFGVVTQRQEIIDTPGRWELSVSASFMLESDQICLWHVKTLSPLIKVLKFALYTRPIRGISRMNKELLSGEFLVRQGHSLLGRRGRNDSSWDSIGNWNMSQSEAIEQSLSTERYITKVIGPPGTGKTFVNVGILCALAQSSLKVLQCGPTNFCVREIAKRFHTQKKKMDPCWDANSMLLIGRYDTLFPEGCDQNDVLHEVYLGTRVESVNSLVRRIKAFRVDLGSKLSKQLTNVDFDAEPMIELLEKFPQVAEHLRIVDSLQCIIDTVATLSIEVTQRQYETIMLYAVDVYKTLERNETFLGRNSLNGFFIRLAGVIFCTVNSAGSGLLNGVRIDVCIIDEACQTVEAECLLVLRPELRKLILIGDPQQLRSTVISNLGHTGEYGRSLFERLDALGHPHVLLDKQYRMHPTISHMANELYYKGMIKDDDSVLQSSLLKDLRSESVFTPLRFFDVRDSYEEVNEKMSKRNINEANIVCLLLENFLKKYAETVKEKRISIGVICPYEYQRTTLAEQFKSLKKRLKKAKPLTRIIDRIDIRSIDGFQGQERDIVILSMTRANEKGLVGFLGNANRLNVAITRSRYSLWVVGNSQALEKAGDEVLVDLLSYIKTCGYYSRISDVFKESVESVREYWTIQKREYATESSLNCLKATAVKKTEIFADFVWDVQFTQNAKDSAVFLAAEERKSLFSEVFRIGNGRLKSEIPYKSQSLVGCLFRVIRLGKMWRMIFSVMIDDSRRCQILRVWNIVKRTHLGKAYQYFRAAMSAYSDEYLTLCATLSEKQGKLCVPCTSVHCANDYRMKVCEIETEGSGVILGGSVAATGQVLSVTKNFAITPEILKTLIVDQVVPDYELPNVLDRHESEIVSYGKSCFVLGRSGTGKTTVIVRKIFNIATNSAVFEGEPVSQLFVTVSKRLCKTISMYYERLDVTARATHTKSAELMNECQKGLGSGVHLEGEDIEDDLVDGYSLCVSAEVPQFWSFLEFAYTLDKTLERPFFTHETSVNEISNVFKNTNALTKKGMDLRKLVDYNVFTRFYYPRLSDEVRKLFDSAFVFMQISTYIKGSLEAMESNGFMSIEQFCALSETREGNDLNISHRKLLYNAFRKYEQYKQHLGEYDYPDVCFHIYSSILRDGYRGKPVNFIYIDEVQDLLPCQILLFRFLTNNLNGFLFCGDTAQCITGGSRFRFEVLKDTFFRYFFPRIAEDKRSHYVPQMFYLSRNYRSAPSILRVANLLVSLLEFYYPGEIDKLPDETSLFRALDTPLFFEETDLESVRSYLVGNSDSEENTFGAEQIVLVLDDTSKNKVRNLIPSAIVLNIVEAKGLEWSDVLLFNFFSDSELGQRWRVLSSFLQQCGGEGKGPTQRFDPQKHNALSVELKLLYVAVTRAKSRLWFFDEMEECRQPFLDVLVHKKLISVVKHSDLEFPLLQTSTPEEWRKKGMEYRNAGHLEHALIAFKYSNDDKQVNITQAMLFEAKATEMIRESFGNISTEARGLLLSAAQAFEFGEQFLKAARLYERSEEYSKAADLYKGLGRFKDCLLCYLKEKNVEVLLQNLEDSSVKRCLDVEDIDAFGVHLVDFYIGSFGSKESVLKRTFQVFMSRKRLKAKLREFPSHVQYLIDLEIEDKNFSEAAVLYVGIHWYFHAAEMFLHHFTKNSSIDSLMRCIDYYWKFLYTRVDFQTGKIQISKKAPYEMNLNSKKKRSALIDKLYKHIKLAAELVTESERKTRQLKMAVNLLQTSSEGKFRTADALRLYEDYRSKDLATSKLLLLKSGWMALKHLLQDVKSGKDARNGWKQFHQSLDMVTVCFDILLEYYTALDTFLTSLGSDCNDSVLEDVRELFGIFSSESGGFVQMGCMIKRIGMQGKTLRSVEGSSVMEVSETDLSKLYAACKNFLVVDFLQDVKTIVSKYEEAEKHFSPEYRVIYCPTIICSVDPCKKCKSIDRVKHLEEMSLFQENYARVSSLLYAAVSKFTRTPAAKEVQEYSVQNMKFHLWRHIDFKSVQTYLLATENLLRVREWIPTTEKGFIAYIKDQSRSAGDFLNLTLLCQRYPEACYSVNAANYVPGGGNAMKTAAFSIYKRTCAMMNGRESFLIVTLEKLEFFNKFTMQLPQVNPLVLIDLFEQLMIEVTLLIAESWNMPYSYLQKHVAGAEKFWSFAFNQNNGENDLKKKLFMSLVRGMKGMLRNFCSYAPGKFQTLRLWLEKFDVSRQIRFDFVRRTILMCIVTCENLTQFYWQPEKLQSVLKTTIATMLCDKVIQAFPPNGKSAAMDQLFWRINGILCDGGDVIPVITYHFSLFSNDALLKIKNEKLCVIVNEKKVVSLDEIEREFSERPVNMTELNSVKQSVLSAKAPVFVPAAARVEKNISGALESEDSKLKKSQVFDNLDAARSM